MVSLSQTEGAPTLRAQEQAAEAEKRAALMNEPLVKAVMESFPGASIVERRETKPETETQDDEPAEGDGSS